MTDAESIDKTRARSASAQPAGMRLADMVSEEAAGPTFSESFPPATVARFVIIAALFSIMNLWQFKALVLAWMNDANWSHGFLIPLFSVFFVYTRWSELKAARRRVCLWGLPLVVVGAAFTILGFYPIGTRMVSELSMILLLFGLVLYLAGPTVAKLVWLPVFFLVFAVPIPNMLYTRIATPLQELAAAASTMVLRVAGVQINVVRSSLELVSRTGHMHPLTVAEACSGVRSLMAFMALGVAMAYLGQRPLWQRIVLVLATIPVAIFCNVLRVVATCTMFYLDKPELGQDFMHTFTGMLVLVPAVLIMWLLSIFLNLLYVEVDDDDQENSAAAGETAGGEVRQ